MAHGLALVALWATADVPARVAALDPGALGGSPWFVPGQALDLYVLLPLAVLSAAAVWLAPGLWLVAAFSRPLRPAALALKGFLVSLGLQGAATAALALLSPGRVSDAGAVAAGVGLGIGAAALYRLRVRVPLESAPAQPEAAPTLRRVGWLVALPTLATVALLPVLFWLDLNDDGMEALELGRSLRWFALPRAPVDEWVGLGIGMVTVAYPIRWFQALWGAIEATARLPLVLYLVPLHAAVVLLIERGRRRVLAGAEEALVAAALAVVVLALAFNASYDPYLADPASPTAFSLLTVTLMLGVAWGLLEGRTGWFLAFALAGYLTRPTVLPMTVFLAAGVVLAHPGRWRWIVGRTAGAVALWVALAWASELALRMAGAEVIYTAQSLVDRFRYLRFTLWERLPYVLLPGGILPALALVAWKRHDPASRALVAAAVPFFLLISLPAFFALHHYAPLMVLPLVVYWRLWLDDPGPRPAVLGATAGALALSAILVAPRDVPLARTFRDVGARTAVATGEYGSDDYETHVAALAVEPALGTLFPNEWDVDDPTRELVVGLQLVHYARAEPEDADYLFLPAGTPLPDGLTRVGEVEGVAVAVADPEGWRREREAPRATGYRSPRLTIPRETLFFFFGIPAVNYHLDLSTLPGVWRLFD